MEVIFFAYEGFWKFFVFRRRKNGCASGIILGRNRVILFGVAFMKSTYDETESQSAQQYRRYIFRIVLRLVLDRSSINLRSFSVHSPFDLRSRSVRESKNDLRINGERTKKYRTHIGFATKGQRNTKKINNTGSLTNL